MGEGGGGGGEYYLGKLKRFLRMKTYRWDTLKRGYYSAMSLSIRSLFLLFFSLFHILGN